MCINTCITDRQKATRHNKLSSHHNTNRRPPEENQSFVQSMRITGLKRA